MGASAIEFRLRMVINAAIIILGFLGAVDRGVAHWPSHLAAGWLALELSRTGLVSFAVATPLLLIVAGLDRR